MFLFSQPALRHFAVIKRLKLVRSGALWRVTDRRGFGSEQLLLVPGRHKVWPLLLVSLNSVHASPVRLRNGKVAILVNASDVKLVSNLLRANPKSKESNLNALTGFEPRFKKRKLAPAALVISALVVSAVAIIPRPQEKVTTQIEQTGPTAGNTCGKEMLGQSLIEGVLARYKQVQISEGSFKVASAKKLGGLYQVKLRRMCDGKYFRVDAWSRNSEIVISKIY